MHVFPVTVHYEDTDMGGIVYHANYLKFIERGRSSWVRDIGIDQNAMRADGLVFVVRRIDAEFLAPARLDDGLEVRTQLAEMRGARFVMRQEVAMRDTGARLFAATVTIATMALSGRPARLPQALRARINAA